MDQHCIDKIKKEIRPILRSFPDKYKNRHLPDNFHIICYYHCVNCLPKNKHEEFIDKCIKCVKSKKEYYIELEAYKILEEKYINQMNVYYNKKNFTKNFLIIAKQYGTNKIEFPCVIERKTKQMTELKKHIERFNLQMNEYLVKIEDETFIPSKKRKLSIQKYYGNRLDESLEDDILRIASQLV